MAAPVKALFLSLVSFIVLFMVSLFLIEHNLKILVFSPAIARFRPPPLRYSADDVLWIIKTGKMRRERLQAQLTAMPYKHRLVVSDEETDLFGVHVYDVLARIAPEARSAVQSSPGFQKKGGWDMDQFKFFPAISLARSLHPRFKFYMMIDDDTFIFDRNFFEVISNIEADPMANALYFGRVSTFSGCGQILGENGWAIDNQTRLPMHFAHGGSGILMTNKAVAQLDERAASCSARHASCWAGDIALGICFFELKIPLSDKIGHESYVFWGGSHLNPHEEDVMLESSCKQQVALHKLSSEELLMLGALQQRARGPINYAELVRRFLARRFGQNATTRWSEHDFELDGFDHMGKDFESSYVGKGGLKECQRRCEINRFCLACTYVKSVQMCFLKNRISAPVISRANGATLTIYLSHVRCELEQSRVDSWI